MTVGMRGSPATGSDNSGTEGGGGTQPSEPGSGGSNPPQQQSPAAQSPQQPPQQQQNPPTPQQQEEQVESAGGDGPVEETAESTSPVSDVVAEQAVPTKVNIYQFKKELKKKKKNLSFQVR